MPDATSQLLMPGNGEDMSRGKRHGSIHFGMGCGSAAGGSNTGRGDMLLPPQSNNNLGFGGGGNFTAMNDSRM